MTQSFPPFQYDSPIEDLQGLLDRSSGSFGRDGPASPQTSYQNSALKKQRLQALMDQCREQVLQQVIGPFGLTPTMFSDKLGGNVTTQHNAEQDIYAKDSEGYNRTDYDYAQAKADKLKEGFKSGQINSQEFVDEYTGHKEASKRAQNTDGKLVKNFELDHTVPLKEIHQQGGWMLGKEERKAAASEKRNLHYTTHENNREKGDETPEKALSAESGYDEELTKPLIDDARDAVKEHLPTTAERLEYHARELGSTGAREFLNTGARRALGMLMFEVVNGSFIEAKHILMTSGHHDPILDRIIDSVERVMQRVQERFKDILSGFFSGGVQGFVSNLLTFLINNLVTTSAKIVTLIRESMEKLWQIVKLLAFPSTEMSAEQRTRLILKSVVGLFTTAAGMMWEPALNSFLLTIPPLAPLAAVISPILSGLLTGLAAALLMYAIDSLVDWALDKGTAFLNAQLEAAHLNQSMCESLASRLAVQTQLGMRYRSMIETQNRIDTDLETAGRALAITRHKADGTLRNYQGAADAWSTSCEAEEKLRGAMEQLIGRYKRGTQYD